MAETTATTPAAKTKVAGKKKENRPAKAEWPKDFVKGIKVRSSFVLRAKNPDEKSVPDLPQNYVSYEELDAESFDSVMAHLSNDKERAKKYLLKGLNDASRQAAAFGARKIEKMIDNLCQINKRLTRDQARVHVMKALAATA